MKPCETIRRRRACRGSSMAIIEPKSSAKYSGWSIMFTPPRAGREELPVPARLEDVRMAGERPEARPLAEPRHLGLLVERDGALAAKRRECALAVGAARHPELGIAETDVVE